MPHSETTGEHGSQMAFTDTGIAQYALDVVSLRATSVLARPDFFCFRWANVHGSQFVVVDGFAALRSVEAQTQDGLRTRPV